MTQKVTQAKTIQRKSWRLRVRQIGPNWFKVSDPDTHQAYDVNLGLNGGTCTCPWGRHRPRRDHRSGCSHVIAAMRQQALKQGQHLSVWANEEEARRQHRPMLSIGDGLILTTRLD